MNDEISTAKFIAQLVKLTKRRSLQWEVQRANPFSTTQSDEAAFIAQVEDRTLRLSRVPKGSIALSELFGKSQDGSVSVSDGSYRLEILGEGSVPLYQIRTVSGLNDLYESVSAQVAKVDLVVNRIMSME